MVQLHIVHHEDRIVVFFGLKEVQSQPLCFLQANRHIVLSYRCCGRFHPEIQDHLPALSERLLLDAGTVYETTYGPFPVPMS